MCAKLTDAEKFDQRPKTKGPVASFAAAAQFPRRKPSMRSLVARWRYPADPLPHSRKRQAEQGGSVRQRVGSARQERYCRLSLHDRSLGFAICARKLNMFIRAMRGSERGTMSPSRGVELPSQELNSRRIAELAGDIRIGKHVGKAFCLLTRESAVPVYGDDPL